MRHLAFLLMAVVFALPAIAGETSTPPKEFQKPWRGEVVFDTVDRVNQICGGEPRGRTSVATVSVQGCQGHTKDGRIVVVLPLPCEAARREGGGYAALVCHEVAHAVGWPANHPRTEDRK